MDKASACWISCGLFSIAAAIVVGSIILLKTAFYAPYQLTTNNGTPLLLQPHTGELWRFDSNKWTKMASQP